MMINGLSIEKGLIVRQPWLELILSGLKTWGMRSTSTKFRRNFALIEQGTGLIVGLAELVDVGEPMNLKELTETHHKHRVPYGDSPGLIKWNTPWYLSNVRRIKPIPYDHKRGAVIWVNI